MTDPNSEKRNSVCLPGHLLTWRIPIPPPTPLQMPDFGFGFDLYGYSPEEFILVILVDVDGILSREVTGTCDMYRVYDAPMLLNVNSKDFG